MKPKPSRSLSSAQVEKLQIALDDTVVVLLGLRPKSGLRPDQRRDIDATVDKLQELNRSLSNAPDVESVLSRVFKILERVAKLYRGLFG